MDKTHKLGITILLGIFSFTCTAQTTNDKTVSSPTSLVKECQKVLPFNGNAFCSNATQVVAITPPTVPLVITLETNNTYEEIDKLLTPFLENWDEFLIICADCPGFIKFAEACYNLQIPLEIDYKSKIDNRIIKTVYTINDLEILLLNNKY